MQKHKSCDHGRHVGVQDCRECFAVSRVDRRSDAAADGELFADPLKDKDVGVDRHAECQNDPRNAGERHGRLQILQGRPHEEEVEKNRDRGDKASKAIIADHSDDDEHHRYDCRQNAGKALFGPKLWADIFLR